MKTLVCFLEERSAQRFLESVLPRLLPEDIQVRYIPFEGKQDLKRQIVKKLRSWRAPDSIFLVMSDQDSQDCGDVKAQFAQLCAEAGKSETLIRIACHELESFYFGDLSAVGKALHLDDLASYQNNAQYRIPDSIITPSKELDKITRGAYQKIGGSREIGKVISLKTNTSHSYMALLSGIKRLCGLEETTSVQPQEAHQSGVAAGSDKHCRSLR